ncbi:MAG TPA: hypothetical protein DCL77_02070 [Prolixibacteraceae bacterium]|nr:hypothetical protein [Prolixibacteraceae bacterium]
MKSLNAKSLENSKDHYIFGFNSKLHHEADMDFKAGVAFATSWIQVEDEMPEHTPKLRDHRREEVEQTIRVLSRTDEENISDNKRIRSTKGKREWIWKKEFDGQRITHWRLLNIV